MKKLNFSSLALALWAFVLAAPIYGQQIADESPLLKKRIVVFDMEDRTGGGWDWYGGASLGEGISDMIITELVQSGRFRVIEREQMKRILEEQELARQKAKEEERAPMKMPEGWPDNFPQMPTDFQSGAFPAMGMQQFTIPAGGHTPSPQAIELGKVLGAEVGIYGAVTEYGYRGKNNQVYIPGTSIGIGKKTATVGVDLRIIDINSGEVLYADNVYQKQSFRSGGVNVLGFGFESKKDMDNSVIGKVTRQAIEEIVGQTKTYSEGVEWQAYVIMERDGKVYVNSGANDGLSAGLVFTVFREEEELVDPLTGLKLGGIDTEVGAIEVIDPAVGEGKVAVCRILEGSLFLKGDKVRLRETAAFP